MQLINHFIVDGNGNVSQTYGKACNSLKVSCAHVVVIGVTSIPLSFGMPHYITAPCIMTFQQFFLQLESAGSRSTWLQREVGCLLGDCTMLRRKSLLLGEGVQQNHSKFDRSLCFIIKTTGGEHVFLRKNFIRTNFVSEMSNVMMIWYVTTQRL